MHFVIISGLSVLGVSLNILDNSHDLRYILSYNEALPLKIVLKGNSSFILYFFAIVSKWLIYLLRNAPVFKLIINSFTFRNLIYFSK